LVWSLCSILMLGLLVSVCLRYPILWCRWKAERLERNQKN